MSSDRPGTVNYKATLKPMDVRGWSWKQIVMGAAMLVSGAVRELAHVHLLAAGLPPLSSEESSDGAASETAPEHGTERADG